MRSDVSNSLGPKYDESMDLSLNYSHTNLKAGFNHQLNRTEKRPSVAADGEPFGRSDLAESVVSVAASGLQRFAKQLVGQ